MNVKEQTKQNKTKIEIENLFKILENKYSKWIVANPGQIGVVESLKNKEIII